MPSSLKRYSQSDIENAVAASHSIQAFADHLGISRGSVYNYARNDVRFAAALDALRSHTHAERPMRAYPVRLSDSLADWLEWQAAEDGVSKSDVIRDWLEQHPGYLGYLSLFD